MHKIKIAGKELSLAFTLAGYADLMKLRPDFQLEKIGELAHTPDGLIDLIYVLAKQGELLEGRKLDIDQTWIGTHINCALMRITKYQIIVLDTIAEGFKMETEDGDEDREIDVVLEELKKKGIE